MITNRYYITTIIAIFLSLSLGILLGGTLGQQWINDNQKNLITHYEQKAKQLAIDKEELSQQNEELNIFYEKLKEDYKNLFTDSIANSIEGKKILWIDDTNHSFEPLKNTVTLAGGLIQDVGDDTEAFIQSIDDTYSIAEYDAILFFPNEMNFADYQWFLEYDIPVIYITDNQSADTRTNDVEIDIYEQKVDLNSLNEHYKFILFLENLLQES